MSIVCRATKTGEAFELMSLQEIPRKKRFYVKDSQRYYFIPEMFTLPTSLEVAQLFNRIMTEVKNGQEIKTNNKTN